MPKPIIDYDAVRRFILVMMYEAYAKDQRMDFSPERVRQRLPVLKNLIAVSFDRLEGEGLILEDGRQQSRQVGVLGERTVQEWVGTGSYKLTDRGREHVEKMPDETYDLSLAALANGTAASAYQIPSGVDRPPPPDRWEPLPIELGDPELATVRTALDEVVERVEHDNGYKSEFPDERAEVLSALHGATTLLDQASQVTYSSFVTYVQWPLERLLKRFDPNTLIGAASVVLWDAVKTWVKSKIGLGLDDVFKGMGK